MSELKIYRDAPSPELLETVTDGAAIAAALARVGVDFERWEAAAELPPGADQATVLEAYQADIQRLKDRHGFATADVVSLSPDHPERAAMRRKFLDEHRHSEFEVRFFVAGQGLFYLHVGENVYAVLCTRGDLISVPAGTTHWFDMGPAPDFTAIRLFTDPAGWVAEFTGDDIAGRYPLLEKGA